MDEVATGVYALSGLKMGRSYLIEDEDGLTLIDTSSPSASQGILDAIGAIGRSPDDLRTIVATHYHFDHTGNVAALVERTGATFCAHADDAPYIDGRVMWLPMQGIAGKFVDSGKRHYALRVDRELRTGDSVAAAGGMEVVHAPGHTPGSIALHARGRRLLFAGDAFMHLAGLMLPPSMSSHDLVEARRSVARLAELDFDIALPGHGRPIVGRANEKLADWSRRWLA